jgi:hypothetical protein
MDTKKDPEITTMQVVLNALQPLDSAGRNRVIQWVSQKLSFDVDVQQKVLDVKSPVVNNSTSKSIKEFVASKKPNNTYQRLACLAYFLDKYKQQPNFKNKDIVIANSEAKLPKISNVTAFINHATNPYGFFASTGKGNRYLTTLGEDIVNVLPDQNVVKTTMEQNKTKKHTKRKTKVKKQ